MADAVVSGTDQYGHDWRAVTAPNGDKGWQCQRCRLTAITLPLRRPIPCPPTEVVRLWRPPPITPQR